MTSTIQRPIAEIVADGLCTGALATVATTAVAAACGEMETDSAVTPINAVSHILWGDRAANQSQMSVEYTVPGLVLNSAAVTSWAVLQEFIFGRRHQPKSISQALTEGAIISGLAYVTDYHVVPSRLTPGFEKRLSNNSLATIYGALAISLGIGSWLRRRNT